MFSPASSFDPSQYHFPFLTSYTVTQMPRLGTLPLLTFPLFFLHTKTYAPPFASTASQLVLCLVLTSVSISPMDTLIVRRCHSDHVLSLLRRHQMHDDKILKVSRS